jgi:hypothetical protein
MIENGISKTTILTTSLTLKTMGLVLNKLWLFAASQLSRVSQVIRSARSNSGKVIELGEFPDQKATGNFCFGEMGGRNSNAGYTATR